MIKSFTQEIFTLEKNSQENSTQADLAQEVLSQELQKVEYLMENPSNEDVTCRRNAPQQGTIDFLKQFSRMFHTIQPDEKEFGQLGNMTFSLN